ncbi:hypothetical protein [Sphingomonas sp.]|uniref:hypothetical protein n=1 Tax=Sphingomonas sp. TaxID=28214 RepID=UPI0017ECB62C|nr:hypothetical protein [Sphingomonas sp.]MBA4763079.1 hypothetical protein [Sphingomonas sp.]
MLSVPLCCVALSLAPTVPAPASPIEPDQAPRAEPAADGGVARNLRVRAQYLMPQRRALFGQERDIDIATLNIYHDWQLPLGVTLSATGGFLVAQGELRSPGQAPRASNASGVSAGGVVRIAPLRIGTVTPFAEGSIEFLYTFGKPFPAGGTSVNGFLRWGAGASVAVSRHVSVEAGWQGAHISNGGKDGSYNPGWDGRGPFVGVSFRR